jgi:hypothetical protein
MNFRATSSAWLLITVFSAVAAAQQVNAPAALPTIPPAAYSISPVSVERGASAQVTIEGRNLSGLKEVLFDGAGLTAKLIGVTDVPEKTEAYQPGNQGTQVVQAPKQRAVLDFTVAAAVKPGVHRLRLRSDLGSSNSLAFFVSAYPLVSADAPGPVSFPATLAGMLSRPAQTDRYSFHATAGQDLVFKAYAGSLGAGMSPVLTIWSDGGDSGPRELVRSTPAARGGDPAIVFKAPADGNYTLAVTDETHTGGWNNFYRIVAGALPYVSGVFPLGVQAGHPARVTVWGANLGTLTSVPVVPPASVETWKTIPLTVQTPLGPTINSLSLNVTAEPDVLEREPNDSPAQAQLIPIPAAVDGHIAAHAGATAKTADEDFFRFHALRGQRLDIQVAAARLGSPLDSVIEVLDTQGREIPRAQVRSVWSTTMTLADRTSRDPATRLTSITGLGPRDYLMVGDEINQIVFVPDQPDEDVMYRNFEYQRLALLGTTATVHPTDTAVYKVQILPPDAHFPPNGMPVFTIPFRNDDGGPGYGADSHLVFTAPADGDYLLHLKDVRGMEGDDFAYRLTVREAQPDFSLTMSPSNPNIPRGGTAPLVVSVDRRLGYDGPISLVVDNLPAGVAASPAVIPAHADSAVISLAAAADAVNGAPGTLRVTGHATVAGREVVREADPDDKLKVVSIMPPPDIVVSVEPRQVTLVPGEEANVTVKVARHNGFKGRVPYNLLGLPEGVTVVNMGFTGGFITESESSRTIQLRAAPWVETGARPVYVVGTVESNSSTQHVSGPLLLTVAGDSGINAARKTATATLPTRP